MISLFVMILWIMFLFSGFDDSVPPTDDKTFKIETRPDIVESIEMISGDKMPFWGFDIELKQNSTDYLEIMIPKNLPTPASFTNTWYVEPPFVLVDGKEIGYETIDDPCYNIYKIPISNQTKIEFAYAVILAGTWQLYSPVQFDESHPCYHKVFYEKPVDSPLKQFKSGVPIDKIQCKEKLELIIKSSDDSPACVKEETKAKLIDIGWVKTQVDVHDDSVFIESTKDLDEVRLFLSLHPDAKASVNHEWFTVEYEKSGFREHTSSNIIHHTKRLIISIDYEGRPSAHSVICGGPVSLESPNVAVLKNPDWCFPLDQSKFNSLLKQENEHDVKMDCNNMDGRVEAQCFKDSFESCAPAITHSVIYTIEGDALYLKGVIADDCKIHVTFDNSGDRFGGSDRGINSYVCNNVELHEEHIWVIDDCAGYPEFQINYVAQEWASAQKCTDLGGVWNYTFHNCVGIFDENQCQKSGGTIACMSYEQMDHGRDVCQGVCEFEPVDRK